MNYLKVFKNNSLESPIDPSSLVLKTLKSYARVNSHDSFLAKKPEMNHENLIGLLAIEDIKNKIIEDTKNEIIGIIKLLIEKVFLQKSNKKNSLIENQLKEIIGNKNKNKIYRLEISENESKNLSQTITANLDIQINNRLEKGSAVIFVADRRIEINLENQIRHLQNLISESEIFSLELRKSIKKLL